MGLAELADLAVAGTGLGPWDFILLCGTSFLGSFITAGLDLGGGVPVFATMALYLTPAALIPLHGVVQLGSNLGRTALLARHVLFPIVPAFLAGTVLGAAGGGQLVVTLPVPVLQAILALFVATVGGIEWVLAHDQFSGCQKVLTVEGTHGWSGADQFMEGVKIMVLHGGAWIELEAQG